MDIPKQVVHNSKQQHQQQFSDWFSSEFLFCRRIHYQQARICPNLLPISLGIRIGNVTREKRKIKEPAGAQEKLAVTIADTRVAPKRCVSKARQRMELRLGNLE